MIAVIAVWLFHCGLLDYGYLGVQVFFAISGFVIAQSAQNRTRYDFAIARLARLWPGFIICLTLTVLVAPVPRDAMTLLANMTMVPRIFGIDPVEGAYWSLLVEILFYAYVGILLIGPNFVTRLRVMLVIWLGLCALHLLQPLPGKVLLILEWGPYFVIGGACWRMGRGITGARALWIAAIIVAALAAAQQTRFDPTIAAMVVVTSGLLFPLLARSGTGHPMLSLAGALSYPIYLLQDDFGIALTDRLHQPLLTIVIVFLLAWLITRFEPLARRRVVAAGNSVRAAAAKLMQRRR